MSRGALLEPIAPEASDAPALQVMDKAFSTGQGSPRLVSATGEELPLPESVYKLLRSVVHVMASGRAITIVPVNLELTTQEAADILNVSRPHVVKLLETGTLPHRKVGTHRRIRFEDLMSYKHRQDDERQRVLDELAQLSQDDGMY